MKTKEMRKKNPAEAWGNSLEYVLTWPLACYAIAALMTFLSGTPGFAVFWVLGGGVGMVIHFICYFLFGLPVYFAFWESKPSLWTARYGLPLGFVTGGFAMAGVLALNGTEGFELDFFLGAFLFGGIYGLVSAAGAVRSRRKTER